MQRSPRHPEPASGRERGIALVAAVLMLLLTSVLAGTFMASTTSERAISGNVHVARASLVAADAGVRVAQQAIANIGITKLDSCNTAWDGTGLVVKNFKLFAGPYTVTSTNPRYTATARIAFVDSGQSADLAEQQFDYAYTIDATGSAGSFGTRQVQSKGILRLSVERGSFTDYLIFTNTHTTASGGAIWFTSGTTFDGRVHTNTQFRFAYQPVFQDLVSSVNSKAWFYNKGNPVERAASSYGSTDQPSFFGGFTRSAATVPIPTNSFSQQGASLGLGGSMGALTNSQINTALLLGSGSTAPPNGVYVVHDASNNMRGGFYVRGSLDSCVMFVNGSGNQVYRFRQGTTSTMVTVDKSVTPPQTIVKVGTATPVTYTGAPVANVIYATGSISNLCGPTRPNSTTPAAPAIANGNQLMITAVNDIVIQRDITYQDYDHGESVLGIYSQGGSVRIGTNMPREGLLDAFVMATGTNGTFTVDNYDSGSPRGTFHLRGGMVTSYYGGFFTFNTDGSQATGFQRDYHYDRRGFKPPFFPQTTRFNTNAPVARTLSWKEM